MVTNIVVFCITFGVGCFVYSYGSNFYYFCKQRDKPSAKKQLLRISLVALACLPFDIGGNKITLIGGGTSEKSFYSFFSIWQEAKEKTFSFVEVGYRESKENLSVLSLVSNTKTSKSTDSFLKILSINKTDGTAFTVISILADKESRGTNTALVSAISVENSTGGASNTIIPILSFQHGEKETFSGIGLSLLIDSPNHERWLAPALLQMGDKNGKRFFVLY